MRASKWRSFSLILIFILSTSSHVNAQNKKAQEKGDIISVTAEKPKLHSGEDTRWDFKVSITFKNAVLAFDPNLTTPYKSELYPNQDKLTKDEQHRFELLIAHWDVMVENVDLK